MMNLYFLNKKIYFKVIAKKIEKQNHNYIVTFSNSLITCQQFNFIIN